MTQYTLADGGTVTVTNASTGNSTTPYDSAVQKYDADGNPVGDAYHFSGGGVADFDALSNGGYVLTEALDANATYESVFVFGPNGGSSAVNVAWAWNSVQVTSSPDGGFMVESHPMQFHGSGLPTSTIELFDNAGVGLGAGQLYGPPVPITLDAQGNFILNSTATGSTTLVVTPGDPSALQGPATPTLIGAYDDVGPSQGAVADGATTDDPQLHFHVSVSEVGAMAYEFMAGAGMGYIDNYVAVTAQDVANGYVDLTLDTHGFGPVMAANGQFSVTFQAVDSEGVASAPSAAFHWSEADFSASILPYEVQDTAGHQVWNNATDSNLTVPVHLGFQVQAGDTLKLMLNGQMWDQITLTAQQASNHLAILQEHLPNGADSLVAEVSNADQTADSPADRITVNDNKMYFSVTGGEALTEGNSGTTDFTFTVHRSGVISTGGQVSYYLPYVSADVNAADFSGATSGGFHFDAGETTKTIHIAVNGDTTLENDETFQVALVDPGGIAGSTFVIGGNASATILNDDSGSSGGGGGGPGLISITGPGSETAGTSGTTDFAFHVTRTGDLSSAAAVDYYQTYGGSADASDFAGPTAGAAYFQAGQSDAVIHIAVAGDPNPEPDESFTIALSNARGGTIDPNAGEASATIVSDDGGSSTGGSSSVSKSDPDYTAPSGVREITLTGTSSQTVHGNDEGDTFWSNNNANTLIGGTGDDTFHLGRNGDIATGGGGNDVFAFAENPWSPAGRITDFNAGDVIDLTETLHRAGYSSGDPIAEGYVKFQNDSAGNAEVWFDPDPGHSATFWLVTGLDGVDAASLHANAGLITV